MTKIPLTLGKHYLLIDSPISFYLIDNEENSVYRPSGVWQLDTWKLLPEKYQKDHPVYTLSIEYDESKLVDGKDVLIRESDIDLGDGVAGVSGQAVMLTGINDSLLPISVSVSNFPDVQKVSVQNNPTSIGVNNFPANQNVSVTNIPDVQKVSVQNNPTSIGVNNFPANQKVTVQNDFSSCYRYLLISSSWASLKDLLQSYYKEGLSYLILYADNAMFFVHAIAFQGSTAYILADKESTSDYFRSNQAKLYTLDTSSVGLTRAVGFCKW